MIIIHYFKKDNPENTKTCKEEKYKISSFHHWGLPLSLCVYPAKKFSLYLSMLKCRLKSSYLRFIIKSSLLATLPAFSRADYFRIYFSVSQLCAQLSTCWFFFQCEYYCMPFVEDLHHLFTRQTHTVHTSHFPGHAQSSVFLWLHKCCLQSCRSFSFLTHFPPWI